MAENLSRIDHLNVTSAPAESVLFDLGLEQYFGICGDGRIPDGIQVLDIGSGFSDIEEVVRNRSDGSSVVSFDPGYPVDEEMIKRRFLHMQDFERDQQEMREVSKIIIERTASELGVEVEEAGSILSRAIQEIVKPNPNLDELNQFRSAIGAGDKPITIDEYRHDLALTFLPEDAYDEVAKIIIPKKFRELQQSNAQSFVGGIAQNLPFRDGSFDLVVSHNVISQVAAHPEHSGILEEMIQEAIRVRSSKGLIALGPSIGDAQKINGVHAVLREALDGAKSELAGKPSSGKQLKKMLNRLSIKRFDIGKAQTYPDSGEKKFASCFHIN